MQKIIVHALSITGFVFVMLAMVPPDYSWGSKLESAIFATYTDSKG